MVVPNLNQKSIDRIDYKPVNVDILDSYHIKYDIYIITSESELSKSGYRTAIEISP